MLLRCKLKLPRVKANFAAQSHNLSHIAWITLMRTSPLRDKQIMPQSSDKWTSWTTSWPWSLFASYCTRSAQHLPWWRRSWSCVLASGPNWPTLCCSSCALFALVRTTPMLIDRHSDTKITVRLLFFLLTVGGAVFSAGDYVIIELPSFLYFSALSFFVIIW